MNALNHCSTVNLNINQLAWSSDCRAADDDASDTSVGVGLKDMALVVLVYLDNATAQSIIELDSL